MFDLYNLFRTSTLDPNLSIKIVKAPEGDAPPEIRAEWVDIIMPAREIKTGGDLEKEMKKRGGIAREAAEKGGFIVRTKEALELLELVSPKAAAWYKKNLPKEAQEGESDVLFFASNDCEIIGGTEVAIAWREEKMPQ